MKTWRTRYVGDGLIQCSCSKGVELEAKGQLQVSGRSPANKTYSALKVSVSNWKSLLPKAV